MASKSKFFRVAVEGGTTDGRIIERSWLEEAAATFDPKTYGARVNMEHIRGYSADKPFCAYGDVLALKTEEVTLNIGGKDEKRLGLYAQIEPTDDLVKLTKAKQKIYTSIEIDPNFSKSGKAYMVGLAVTDSPASLGTEVLSFCAKGQAPVTAANLNLRKLSPENLFTEALEFSLELEPDGKTDELGAFASVMTKIFGPLVQASAQTGGAQTGAAAPAGAASPPQPVAGGDQSQGFAQLQATVQAAMVAFGVQADQLASENKAAIAGLEAKFNGLTAQLEKTPQGGTGGQKFTQRPASTGGAGAELTDC